MTRLKNLLKYPTERRVGARGLHDFLGNHGACSPGALTGRVFQQAARLHRIFTRRSIGIIAMLVALAASNRASAAVSEGAHYTNAVAANEQRISLFFEAEQCFQEKLKVGRERYEQKQVVRSNVIAAMSAELQAREQTVVMGPPSASDGKIDELASGSQPWLAVASLAIGCGGLACYLNRQRAQVTFVRRPAK